jgi:uncharacterized protein
MVVGVCRVSLLIEESQSLKDKRSVLRRIKDRVSQKFNCAIAEVGDPDSWQAAQLGFAVVSNERGFTQSMVQKILTFIDDLAIGKLIDDEQDYIDYGDGALEGASVGDYPHWETDEPSPPKPGPVLVRPKAPTLSTGSGELYPWDSPQLADASRTLDKDGEPRPAPPDPSKRGDG